jgi:alanine racemase
MPRPIIAQIHQLALQANLRRAAQLAPTSRVWAVIKANAYGHGIERVLPTFAEADGLALLDLAEAERARAFGWAKPILLLEGFFEAADLEDCARLNLSFSVHHAGQIEMLRAYRGTGRFAVFLKMNSGMNRLGFKPGAYRAAYEALAALPCISSITHMTHFSDADGSRGIAHQLKIFEATTAGLPGERSLSNSAATLDHAAAHANWVRAGIMLYGSSPTAPAQSATERGLQATMSLQSELIATQDLQAGETIGYGSRFTARAPMRIGIVACGYADGYPRSAPDGTPVLVCGVRAPLAGRVSMDMITVDITQIPQAQIGSPVELWGAALPIDEVAHSAGTISYELMCALAPRVPVITVPLE